jgi:uncharacterized caspase-like protein
MRSKLILILIAVVLYQLDGLSQTPNATSQPQKKIALVIGNGNYINSTLANPENDARAIRDMLINLGFEVSEYENLNQKKMKEAIDEFGKKLNKDVIGVFYYAGHGLQTKGYNYLIPVDVELTSEAQIEYDCVQADRVLSLMEEAQTKLNIIILDACRNNPFERSWNRSASGIGLASMKAPSGTLIEYATQPGNTASDGGGKNGLFTSAILESIILPNLTATQMFQNVRSIVSQKSDKQQIPWETSSLIGDFIFNPKILSIQKLDSTDIPKVNVEKRIGLIIGNSIYKGDSLKLKNPVNDANLIGRVLKELDFEISIITNASKEQMVQEINTFFQKIKDYDVCLIYYSGYGLQFSGQNYFIPVSANLNKLSDCETEAISLNNIIDRFSNFRKQVKIIISDASRTSKLRSWISKSDQGFAFINAPNNSILGYSTSPGKTVNEVTNMYSLYASNLSRNIMISQPIEEAFATTRKEVEIESGRTQTPWEITSLTSNFFFKKK